MKNKLTINLNNSNKIKINYSISGKFSTIETKLVMDIDPEYSICFSGKNTSTNETVFELTSRIVAILKDNIKSTAYLILDGTYNIIWEGYITIIKPVVIQNETIVVDNFDKTGHNNLNVKQKAKLFETEEDEIVDEVSTTLVEQIKETNNTEKPAKNKLKTNSLLKGRTIPFDDLI